MGDTTSAQITVYACPPEQVAAVLNVFNEYGFEPGGFAWSPHYDTKMLTLGERAGISEVSCGCSDEISSALMNSAPGVAFEVWEDPKYEWLGSLNVHIPGRGHFGAECDSNGIPQFTPDAIRAIIRKESLEEREKALGAGFESDDLVALLPPKGERDLLPLMDCPECGEWGEDKMCRTCIEVVQQRNSLHRQIVDVLPDSDLYKVVARPTLITFHCTKCNTEVSTNGFVPPCLTDASHESMEIKEASVV